LFDYIVVNRGEVRAEGSEEIAHSAESTTDLLVTWLNDLIFRCETQHRLYTRFDVHVAPDGTSLKATIAGEPIDRDRHILDHEVKAVTQHGLTLERQGETWQAELILDI
jgi:SHS2 domain-containing protein